MLNDDTSLHRCVARERVLARDRPSDLSLVSSTICCTNSTPFPSSCHPHCCHTSVDASASSSSRGQGTFIQKEPSDSGTLWSSSSIFRAYGITHSSVPQKDRRLYLTSSACVRCYSHLHASFLHRLQHIDQAHYTYCYSTSPSSCSVWSSSQSRTSIRSRSQTHPKQPRASSGLTNQVKATTLPKRRHHHISLTSDLARSWTESGTRHPHKRRSEHGRNSCRCLTRCRRS